MKARDFLSAEELTPWTRLPKKHGTESSSLRTDIATGQKDLKSAHARFNLQEDAWNL
jgi:hypothetical protein